MKPLRVLTVFDYLHNVFYVDKIGNEYYAYSSERDTTWTVDKWYPINETIKIMANKSCFPYIEYCGVVLHDALGV